MSKTKQKKIELFFYGTDYSPIVINSKEEKYGFGCSCKYDGKSFETTGNEQEIPKVIANLINSKENQLKVLKNFLEAAQNNIDDMILNRSLKDEGKVLFDYHNQTMYFGGLVGVISIKDFQYNNEKGEKETYDITLQINTRMDCGIEDAKDHFSTESKDYNPFFLMTLLFDGFIPLHNSKVNSDPEALTDMLLLYSFVEKYKNAYVKGYYKTYHRMDCNDSRVKGSIDIARHIRLNGGMNNGKIAYSYKEKSEYNYINHLIIAAYEQLKLKYREQTNCAFKDSIELRDSLESLKFRTEYPQYSKKTLIAKTINPISHPFYTEYEELRKTCLKILREEKESLFNGDKSEKVNGVLMYVPDLWEKYIEKHFRGLKYKAQDQIKIMDVNNDKNFRQNTRPDYVFYDDENKPFMILDAKFKPGWMSVAQNGKMDDLLPDYDKCIRDMVSVNADAAGVLFPTRVAMEVDEKNGFKIKEKQYYYVHNISDFNVTQKFYTFPIYIPPVKDNSTSFTSWKKDFSKSCENAFDKINEIIRNNTNNTKQL